jgi:ribokinase
MITVFGSINVDLLMRVPAFPRPGETIRGEDVVIAPGGKGANQALAACRMNSAVTFVGTVGRDDFADVALSSLREAGVDTTNVAVVEKPTGMALIAVDRSAENQIIVSPGANADTGAVALEKLKTRPGDIFLVQRELSDDVTLEGLRWAKSRQLHRVLNAAPADGMQAEFLAACDTLIVNKSEATTIADSLGLSNEPLSFAMNVARRYHIVVVVTLGSDGVVAHDGVTECRIRSVPINVVDTTGAGDAFVGAMAAAMSEGMSLRACLERGAAAGSLACRHIGAQVSAPLRAQVEAVLENPENVDR